MGCSKGANKTSKPGNPKPASTVPGLPLPPVQEPIQSSQNQEIPTESQIKKMNGHVLQYYSQIDAEDDKYAKMETNPNILNTLKKDRNEEASSLNRAGLLSTQINAIAYGPNGSLFMATPTGVSISPDEGKTFLTSRDGIGENVAVHDIAVTPEGNIVAVTDDKILVSFNGGASFKLMEKSSPPHEEEERKYRNGEQVLNRIYIDNRSNIFVIKIQGTVTVLFANRSVGRENRAVSYSQIESYDYSRYFEFKVNDLIVDEQGRLFLATDKGLYVTSGLRDKNSLSKPLDTQLINGGEKWFYRKDIDRIAISKTGIIYLVTNRFLLRSLNSNYTDFLKIDDLNGSGMENNVHDLYVDQDGGIFVQDIRENRISISRDQAFHFSHWQLGPILKDWQMERINDLVVLPNGIVVVATYNGLLLSSPDSNTFEPRGNETVRLPKNRN